mgnify:CR=1 FL=1
MSINKIYKTTKMIIWTFHLTIKNHSRQQGGQQILTDESHYY